MDRAGRRGVNRGLKHPNQQPKVLTMNKSTQKALLISLTAAAAVVWAANNVDAVSDVLGDKGWF